MTRLPLTKKYLTISVCGVVFILSVAATLINSVPFSISTDLYDLNKSDDLGLTVATGTETFTVFAPTENSDKFSNGVVLAEFKGKLYCQWQSAAVDEDAEDTWVAYSVSENGSTWSNPMELAPTLDNGYRSSGGWWVNGDTLVAYLNTWPASVSPRGGYTFYRTSTDGISWSEIKPVLMADGDTLKGIFEQDPHSLPNGRILSAAHFQPGLTLSPIYTDDPSGVRGWVRASFTNLSGAGQVTREIEPSWYLRPHDSVAVMIFRDQNSTYFKLASISEDNGETWAKAVQTTMPDARTKQSAGNLPDGTAYMVGNPANNSTRLPLTVTLSQNGQLFNTAYVLRKGGSDIQALRFEGRAKRLGYHYPKSIVWNGYLYVSYATNKEDVEITRVPVSSFVLNEIVNQAPQINNKTVYKPENPTNGETITSISATDPEGDPIVYRLLSGNEGGAFSLDSISGIITVADASQIDYERETKFILEIEAFDGNKGTTALITIYIKDVDETDLTPTSVESTVRQFEVYPNPFSEVLNIRGKGFKKVIIYNINNEPVLSSRSSEIDTRSLTSGIYVIIIVDHSNNFSSTLGIKD